MTYQAHGVGAYRETSIRTAGGGRIIVMLYDEAIRRLDDALRLLDSNDKRLDKVNAALIKTQDIITELTVSLDFDRGGEIAQRLYSLYMYFNRTLLDANFKKDPAPIRVVRKMMNDLRESWAEIVDGGGARSEAAGGSLNVAG